MTERRRLLVTGSRSWDDAETVWRALKLVWTFDSDTLLVHGACPRGADLLCEACWDETLGGGTERVPVADWYSGGTLDLSAGIRRNVRMVLEHGPFWGCLAFIRPCERPGCAGKLPDRGLRYHGTHGSVHCANLAEDNGIPVRRFTAPILRL
jgi:hypothetical protein